MDPEDQIEGEPNEEALPEEDGQEVGQADGQEGDGEESHDEEGQEVGEEPAPKRVSRAESRIQKLAHTANEAKARADKLERELADFRAEQRARQQQAAQESPQDRAARRALMDPLDVMREDLAESEKRTANLLHQQSLHAQETNDQAQYASILRDAPHLKKYEGEVEKIRREQQERGIFVPREVLLDLAIGRAARVAAVKGAPKAKAAAAAKVAGQKTTPARASGDTATARGKQGDSPEKRLENVPI